MPMRDGLAGPKLGSAREKGTRCEVSSGLKAAAAPATVSGEHRPRSHCREIGGKVAAMRPSREPGDLPARVAHRLRGARRRADHRSGDGSVSWVGVVPVMSAKGAAKPATGTWVSDPAGRLRRPAAVLAVVRFLDGRAVAASAPCVRRGVMCLR